MSTQYYTNLHAYKMNINRYSGDIAGRFDIVSQMNKANEISNSQEYQTKF